MDGGAGIHKSIFVGNEGSLGLRLDRVCFTKCLLRGGGGKKWFYLAQSLPAETVTPSGAAPQAAPAASETGGLNAQTLQKAIGFAPRNEGGRVTGLVLKAQDDGTMLKLAGFQAGDIVVAVNGRPVSSATDVIAQIRPGARISVEVERGGSKVPIALNLEQ